MATTTRRLGAALAVAAVLGTGELARRDYRAWIALGEGGIAPGALPGFGLEAKADLAPHIAALVYLPPDAELLAGVMCAAPEGSGFSVSFHELRIAKREQPTGQG